MHELRDVEELLGAQDHLPVSVEPDVAHQRDDRVEDLRNAAAERRGVHVEDALALEGLRERADLLDGLLADDVGVVGQRPLAKGNFLEHEAGQSRGVTRVDACAGVSGSELGAAV